MLQIVQYFSRTSPEIVEVPYPSESDNKIIIKTSLSLISSGTEKMLIEFGKSNLIKKALDKPDKVKKAIEKSEDVVDNKKRVNSILEKTVKKLTKVKDKTKEFKDNLSIAISLVKDWITGNYREVPKKTIIYLIGAFIYFLMPIDMIPDFIFKFGLLDDVAVLNFVLTSFIEDIENYKKFKENKEEISKEIDKLYKESENDKENKKTLH